MATKIINIGDASHSLDMNIKSGNVVVADNSDIYCTIDGVEYSLKLLLHTIKYATGTPAENECLTSYKAYEVMSNTSTNPISGTKFQNGDGTADNMVDMYINNGCLRIDASSDIYFENLLGQKEGYTSLRQFLKYTMVREEDDADNLVDGKYLQGADASLFTPAAAAERSVSPKVGLLLTDGSVMKLAENSDIALTLDTTEYSLKKVLKRAIFRLYMSSDSLDIIGDNLDESRGVLCYLYDNTEVNLETYKNSMGITEAMSRDDTMKAAEYYSGENKVDYSTWASSASTLAKKNWEKYAVYIQTCTDNNIDTVYNYIDLGK